MVEDKARKRLPPYVSYRTFRNFTDGLQQQVIPARIDRSYWGDRFSGSTGTQLMVTLRFLGLADHNSMPTERLKKLVGARGERRTEVFRDIANESYSLLFQHFEAEKATPAQLQEAFRVAYGVTGDVCRKCIKFFIALASDGGIPISPHITKKMREVRSGTGTRSSGKKTGARTVRNLPVPEVVEKVPGKMSWDEMLLSKFPVFDPAWPDDVKLKWFAAFDELLKSGFGRNMPDFPLDKKQRHP